MPHLSFTQNLRRHVDCPERVVPGTTVRSLLENAFEQNANLRRYILNDQGALHQHVAIMVNGTAITDRSTLSQALSDRDEVYVMQALSGG